MTAVRRQLAAARRLVVKVGSSSLTSLTGGLDPPRLDALVDALAARRAAGSQVVLVSSGAIAAGLAPLRADPPPARPGHPAGRRRGRAAAARRRPTAPRSPGYGQAIGQVLLTADDMIRRAHYRNAQRTLERLLGLGVLPVVNENDTVATDEIRVGDNDRLAALVAHLIGADGLVLLSDVDGLYDGDPRRPGARLLADVDAPTDLAAVQVARAGADAWAPAGMATKITAAGDGGGVGHPGAAGRGRGRVRGAGRVRGRARRSAPRSGRPGGGCRPAGSGCGTPPTCAAPSTWTPGAVAAVLERRRSLLAAGIHGITGDFVAGDVVDLVGPARHRGGPRGGRLRRGRAARR